MGEGGTPGFRAEPDLLRWCNQGLWDEPGVLPVVVRPRPAVTPRSPRILLVDYDLWLLEKLGSRLLTWGLAVRCEATITRHVRVLAHDPPDLVVLDARLLDHRGLACAEKARDRHPNLPVLLTGAPGRTNEEKALRIGARELVSRPFKMVELKRAVFEALGLEWISVPVPGKAKAV